MPTPASMMNAAMPTMKMLRRRRRLALFFGERVGRTPRGPGRAPGPPSRMSPGSSSGPMPIGEDGRTEARPTVARPAAPPLVGTEADPFGTEADPETPLGAEEEPGTPLGPAAGPGKP